MAKPFPTIGTQGRNRNPNGKAPAPVITPNVTLSVPFADISNDVSVDTIYTFTVLRQGGNVGISDCDWAIVPTAGSGIPAAYFGGTYPSGHIHLINSQGQQSVSFSVPAGVDAAADQFADIVLSNYAGCKPGAVTAFRLRAPGGVVAADYIVTVDVPITSLVRDDTADHAYTVNVTRTRIDNDYSATCSVQLTALGSGATPFLAADFTGGLLNQLVSFAAGQTSKSYTILVKAGTDPATDLTGNISISAPSNCKIDPTASSVAVKIPKAIVVSPGILPPQYTDPNFLGMTPVSPKPTTFAALQTACASLSNSPQCKTKYIQLDPTYNDTATRALPYRGYVDPTTHLIYPLIISGDPAKANSRTTADINARPHFRHFDLNGATWVWIYGLAAEFPTGQGDINHTGQADINPAIELDGSTDCFVTRNWLDAPCSVHSNNAIRPRIGANDFYGTIPPNPPWTTQLRFVCSGSRTSTQQKTHAALVYQNFHGHLRDYARYTAVVNGHTVNKVEQQSCPFYQGEGVSPELTEEPNYPNVPYDLNVRDCWYFNNLMINGYNYNVYTKHAWNVWRNRIVAVNNWNDTVGGATAWHYLAGRGGNWEGGTFKYNVVEGAGGPSVEYGAHCDVEGWNGVWEFNDFGGANVHIFMQCHDPAKLADGRFSKTLLAGSHARFRGNKNGRYVVGYTRADAGYGYFAPLLDVVWEGEQSAQFLWATQQTSTASPNPNGGAIPFDASTHKNTQKLMATFPGDTAKVAVAVGELTNLPTTAAVPQLTLAYAANGFTKAEKGIASQEGILWDGVGNGGGGVDPFQLIASNFTLHFPSDNMATDFPNCSLVWLAGGGFECKAGLGNAIDVGAHACLNMWMKTAPPHDTTTFTFYYTRLDNLAAFDSDGVFTLFRERFKGLPAYGADPNGWAKASWRTDPNYPTAGSDLIYRERGTGYRNSLANRALTAPATMQFRLRTYNGITLDTGTQLFDTTGFTADNVSGGSTFDFPLNVKCKVEVVRNGTSLIGKRTRMDTGAIQEWDWADNLIGTTGRGVDGWCGFGFFLGAWGRVEPVPGVPFCQ